LKRLVIHDREQLVLELANQMPPGGQVLARHCLTYADLQPAREETWWRGVLQGKLKPNLDAYPWRILPGRDAGGGLSAGFLVELAHGGAEYRRAYGVKSLAHLAQSKFLELVRAKEATLDDKYKYYLKRVPAEEIGPETRDDLQFTSCREPIAFSIGSLEAHLAASEPLMGQSDPPAEPPEPCMPIFIRPSAWEEGRHHAYRGGESESAALFSGQLYQDERTQKVFACLDACLEAQHAIEDGLSVTFTGETWSQLRKTLEQRRRRLGRPNEIILASVHRHPWSPGADEDGKRTCDACPTRETCSRTTAVPSRDDYQWHRAVFAGQPWATLLIWGYNARDQEDFRLYELRDLLFEHRSIRLLREKTPSQERAR
jgi:hypothetical protein